MYLVPNSESILIKKSLINVFLNILFMRLNFFSESYIRLQQIMRDLTKNYESEL